MVAQRTLDRKLTTELGRFKNLMSSLTGLEKERERHDGTGLFSIFPSPSIDSELSELKDQNELAGEEIQETKDNVSETHRHI